MESGTCDAPQFFQSYDYATSFGKTYAQAIGCNKTGDELLSCLRSRSTEDIMKSLLDMLNPNWPFTSGTQSNANRGVDVTLHGSYASAAIQSGTYKKYGKGASNQDGSIQLSGVPVGEYLADIFGAGLMKSLRGSPDRKLSSSIPLPALSPVMAWGPCIDGSDYALPQTPLKMFQSGKFNDVPTIFGTNKDEGSIFIPALPIIKQGSHFPPDTHSLEEVLPK